MEFHYDHWIVKKHYCWRHKIPHSRQGGHQAQRVVDASRSRCPHFLDPRCFGRCNVGNRIILTFGLGFLAFCVMPRQTVLPHTRPALPTIQSSFSAKFTFLTSYSHHLGNSVSLIAEITRFSWFRFTFTHRTSYLVCPVALQLPKFQYPPEMAIRFHDRLHVQGGNPHLSSVIAT